MEENNFITTIGSYLFIILYFLGFLRNAYTHNWFFAGLWGILLIINLALIIYRKRSMKK